MYYVLAYATNAKGKPDNQHKEVVAAKVSLEEALELRSKYSSERGQSWIVKEGEECPAVNLPFKEVKSNFGFKDG